MIWICRGRNFPRTSISRHGSAESFLLMSPYLGTLNGPRVGNTGIMSKWLVNNEGLDVDTDSGVTAPGSRHNTAAATPLPTGRGKRMRPWRSNAPPAPCVSYASPAAAIRHAAGWHARLRHRLCAPQSISAADHAPRSTSERTVRSVLYTSHNLRSSYPRERSASRG